MKTIPNARLAMRPTPADLTNLDAIAVALRAAGQPYATRSDAIRHALATIAASVSAPVTPPAAPR